MRDKDVRGMLAALAPAIGRLVCTQPATPRARPAEDLAREAHALLPGVTIEVAGAPGAALDRALASAPAVVVAGSIFLVGEVLDLLVARAAGPVW
jgi:dihydrofolate synthase/folylpolyglutamate synthase